MKNTIIFTILGLHLFIIFGLSSTFYFSNLKSIKFDRILEVGGTISLPEYDSIDELIESYDYAFIGEIDSYIETNQYDGTGWEIPYSFYYVNIEFAIKGNMTSNKEIIKYYGGTDLNGGIF
jgi:hypothetical protein